MRGYRWTGHRRNTTWEVTMADMNDIVQTTAQLLYLITAIVLLIDQKRHRTDAHDMR